MHRPCIPLSRVAYSLVFALHTLSCVVIVRSVGRSRRYHRLYLATKGNKYKTKKQLMEAVHKMKLEKAAEKELKDIAEQKKARAKAQLARKAAKAQQANLPSAE